MIDPPGDGNRQKKVQEETRMDTMGGPADSRTAAVNETKDATAPLSTADRIAARGIASAEAHFQCTRPFARPFVKKLPKTERAWLDAMLFNAVVNAIEAWEVGRASREKEAFYGR